MVTKYKLFRENQDQREKLMKEVVELVFPDYRVDFARTRIEITEEFKVNINDDVDISAQGIYSLPFKFGVIDGNFICSNNNLTSMNNFPDRVNGRLECSENDIHDTSGCTKHIEGSLYLDRNSIEQLNCYNTKVYGNFYCYQNRLIDLVGCPNKIGGQRFDFSRNNITNFEGFPEIYRDDFDINYSHNPVATILNLFAGEDRPEAISKLVEWEVIDSDNMEVSFHGLREVTDDLNMSWVPEYDNVILYFDTTEYTLID
jgi:hypothetical protein